MAASNETIISPDPHTPMAFVPSAQTYATVGSLAVLLWDIFLHLPQDYQLATKSWTTCRVAFFFIIYWISRLASLVYVSGVVIISTADVEQCDYFRLVAIMYPFAMPLAVLPFVVRVFALYRNNKYVVAFVSVTWLFVLWSCVMMPIGVISITTGTRKYCLQSKLLSMPALRVFLFIHDSFIFLATSWALMRNSYGTNLGAKKDMRAMILSRHLLPFSRSILRDGQAYYLVVLIFKLVFLVLPYSKPQVRTQCTIALVLISNMSSHVYRNMRLGFYKDYTISTSAINRAVDVPKFVQQDPEPVFRNPTPSTKHPEDEGDLESGDMMDRPGKAVGGSEVDEFEGALTPGTRREIKTEKM